MSWELYISLREHLRANKDVQYRSHSLHFIDFFMNFIYKWLILY